MSHHNSHRSSRLPRVNIQESRRPCRPRNNIREYPVTADDQQLFDRSTSSGQPPFSWSAAATLSPDTSVSSSHSYSRQAAWAESAEQGTSGADGTFNGNHYSGFSAFRDPVQEGSSTTYQTTSRVQTETSSPREVSPTGEVLAVPPDTNYSPTEMAPQSGYQASQAWFDTEHQGWADPEHQGWAVDANIDPNPIYRRFSMEARQGSCGELLGDATTNFSGSMEEHDIGDASGDMTPIDLEHVVYGCVGGEEEPWSPEFPHQEPRYQYPPY